MSDDISKKSISQTARALKAREISVEEVWNAYAQKKDTLNAYLEKFEKPKEDIARAQKRIDDEKENAPALCGIPLAIKDNILIEGNIASAASCILANHRAPYSATVIEKLKKENVLFLGRTNMDEFALGGSTENSAYGVTKNPYDDTRVAGGTSGGSAAAVSAHLCAGALGTDTGGSVRNPASYCGVVGLKPTYGSVSRYGVIAAASSFDQVGPITKSVEDAEIMFNIIRGKDAREATSCDISLLNKEVTKVGYLGFDKEILEKDVYACFMNTYEQVLTKVNSSEKHEYTIPLMDRALAAYYIINFAEVSSNLSRFDGIRYGVQKKGEDLLDTYLKSRSEGFGAETIRRILLGTFVLSAGYIDAYYNKANLVRDELRQSLNNIFSNDGVDVIAMPTMPTPAFTIGEKADLMSLYLEDVFTVTANLTGFPAISVPMGKVVREGKELPVGIQFMAQAGGERKLFEVAKYVTGEGVY